MMEEKGNSLPLSTMDAQEPRGPNDGHNEQSGKNIQCYANWPATGENFADALVVLVRANWPMVSFCLWSMNTN